MMAHSAIRHLPRWLRPGDLVVANNTRVMPARLRAVKPGTGAKVEILLLNRSDLGIWTALAKPTRKLRPHLSLDLVGASLVVPDAVEIVDVGGEGEIRLRFASGIESRLDEFG